MDYFRKLLSGSGQLICLAIALHLAPSASAEDAESAPAEQPKTLEETVAEFDRKDGLFNLYRDPANGSVYMQVKADQLDREYIYFTYTENGVVEGSSFRGLYRDQGIIRLQKYFNKVEFLEANTRFYFDPASALARASNANITDALLASTEIVATSDDGESFLLKMDGVLLKEALHQVNFLPDPEKKPHEQFVYGKLSEEKSRYAEIRAYPQNVDFLVNYVFENPAPYVAGGDEITDARSVIVKFQHSFIEVPENNYKPRLDDARVGYFRDQITDLTSHSSTPYRDLIQRWHLEKKNPEAEISDPVEPIVWWLENTTPQAYRKHIRGGVLAWNGAFEKSGISNAIEVRQQPDDAEWDAGDIRYNVIRWTSSPTPPFGGYGPRFSNPRTGQIIGADIMMEDVYIANRVRRTAFVDDPQSQGLEQSELLGCAAGFHLSEGRALARISLASMSEEAEMDKLVEQSLYELALHEVGHTLGLMHNMKGTQLQAYEDIHDSAKTGGILSGSIMDYSTVNLAPPGVEQGDYFGTKPGPYDVWAIQFGYDPDMEGERRVAHLARSSEKELGFGNDADDMRAAGRAIDPRVNIGDMSSDAIAYAGDRFALVKSSLASLREKMTVPGESWAELRSAFGVLARDQQVQARVVSRYVGGVFIDRRVAEDGSSASQPYTPVPGDRQRQAMSLLAREIFAADSFVVPEDLITHLAAQRRGYNFWDDTEDPKMHERALKTQRDVLDHLLHPVVLARITDTSLYGNGYPLAEVLADLTDAIFVDDLKGEINSFRQNLQIEYVNRLLAIAVPKDGNPYDFRARSSALIELERIEDWMKRYGKSRSNRSSHAARKYALHLIETGLER